MESSKETQSTDKQQGNHKADRGVLYVIWGDSKETEKWLQRSMQSLRQYHPDMPVHIERFDIGSKINKTKICDLSPFEQTAYLDNDTVVMGRLDFGFDKAGQFGLACCINENPWARRFGDSQLSGDMVEYNSGVLFFTDKARPVFDQWHDKFSAVDGSLLHYQDKQLCRMPAADQASLLI